MTAPRLRSRFKPLPSRLRPRTTETQPKDGKTNSTDTSRSTSRQPTETAKKPNPKERRHTDKSKPPKDPKKPRRKPSQDLDILTFEQAKPLREQARERRCQLTLDLLHSHLTSLPNLRELSIDQVSLHPSTTAVPGLHLPYTWHTKGAFKIPTTPLIDLPFADHISLRHALKEGSLYAKPDLQATPRRRHARYLVDTPHGIEETRAEVDWTEMFLFSDEGSDSSMAGEAWDSDDGEEEERVMDKEATRRLLNGESIMGAMEDVWDRIELARGLGVIHGGVKGGCRRCGVAVEVPGMPEVQKKWYGPLLEEEATAAAANASTKTTCEPSPDRMDVDSPSDTSMTGVATMKIPTKTTDGPRRAASIGRSTPVRRLSNTSTTTTVPLKLPDGVGSRKFRRRTASEGIARRRERSTSSTNWDPSDSEAPPARIGPTRESIMGERVRRRSVSRSRKVGSSKSGRSVSTSRKRKVVAESSAALSTLEAPVPTTDSRAARDGSDTEMAGSGISERRPKRRTTTVTRNYNEDSDADMEDAAPSPPKRKRKPSAPANLCGFEVLIKTTRTPSAESSSEPTRAASQTPASPESSLSPDENGSRERARRSSRPRSSTAGSSAHAVEDQLVRELQLSLSRRAATRDTEVSVQRQHTPCPTTASNLQPSSPPITSAPLPPSTPTVSSPVPSRKRGPTPSTNSQGSPKRKRRLPTLTASSPPRKRASPATVSRGSPKRHLLSQTETEAGSGSETPTWAKKPATEPTRRVSITYGTSSRTSKGPVRRPTGQTTLTAWRMGIKTKPTPTTSTPAATSAPTEPELPQPRTPRRISTGPSNSPQDPVWSTPVAQRVSELIVTPTKTSRPLSAREVIAQRSLPRPVVGEDITAPEEALLDLPVFTPKRNKKKQRSNMAEQLALERERRSVVVKRRVVPNTSDSEAVEDVIHVSSPVKRGWEFMDD